MTSYAQQNLLISFFLFIAFSPELFSQQLPLFTQYREYHSYINPASISHDYFSQEYNLTLGASFRKQWVGLEASPGSLFFKGEYILRTNTAFNLSFGGYLMTFDTDPISTNGAYGKIAALFTEDPYFGAFSVGLTFGALNYQIDAGGLIPFHVNDAILSNSASEQQMVPDIGFGAYYYKQFRDGGLEGDVIYAGLSVPQLLGLDIQFRDNQGTYGIEQQRHVYGVAGYYKYFNELSFFQPSVWVRYVPNAPVQFDLLARYQHNRTFWVGTGIATSKIIHFEGGVFIGNPSKKNSLKIGYGFDYPFSSYGSVFGSAHEINLALLLDTRK